MRFLLPGQRAALMGCHATSIAITVVLPEPVASLSASRVGRALTLVASDTELRLLDGQTEIARHRRSYDRHRQVNDPEHQQALLEDKRKALGATKCGRLLQAAPESEALIQAALERGEPSGSQTSQLLRLLDDYGAARLRVAVREALAKGTPHVSSVAYVLSQRHRAASRRALLSVHLTHRLELEELHVKLSR